MPKNLTLEKTLNTAAPTAKMHAALQGLTAALQGVGTAGSQTKRVLADLRTGLQKIIFTCHNSVPHQSRASAKTQSEGGVGLANVRRRLDLIYGNDYTLDIIKGENDFFVQLTLPLNHDGPRADNTKTI